VQKTIRRIYILITCLVIVVSATGISYAELSVCPKCSGTGKYHCSDCDNTGKVVCTQCNGNKTIDCPNCEDGTAYCDECFGTGEVGDHEVCSNCDGRGIAKCSKCKGKKTIKCDKCGGTGKLDCPNAECAQSIASGGICITCQGCGYVDPSTGDAGTSVGGSTQGQNNLTTDPNLILNGMTGESQTQQDSGQLKLPQSSGYTDLLGEDTQEGQALKKEQEELYGTDEEEEETSFWDLDINSEEFWVKMGTIGAIAVLSIVAILGIIILIIIKKNRKKY